MHYANGQEAKAGDLVFKPANPNYADSEIIGVLVSATAGSTSCNGQLRPYAVRGNSDAGVGPWMPPAATGDWCVTVGDLLPMSTPAMAAAPATPPDHPKDESGS